MSTRRPWTSVELQLLRESYADSRSVDIAKALGRPVGQVYQAADRHGLKKSAEYMASEAACRLRRGGDVGAAHRFETGQQPWNKGTNFVAGGRSAETRFKKGRPASQASNYLPIGSLRLSKDGCLERKVTDDPSIVPARRWVAVHRLVWQEAHGPIPDGHAVAFRPGRRTAELDAITLDALELVTRQELMRRNTVHNWPKPLAQLVQLRGALNRQINRKAKEGKPT